MRRMLLLAIVSFLPMPLAAQDGAAAAAATITANDVRARIGVLAHDSMRGRDTPSPGLESAARYIAREFERFGLAPKGGDGSYIQRYPLAQAAIDPTVSSVTVEGGPTWRYGIDVVHRFGGRAPQGVTGPTVLVSGTPSEDDAAALRGALVIWVLPMQEDGTPQPQANRIVSRLLNAGPAAVLMTSTRAEQRWQELLRQSMEPTLINPREQGDAQFGPLTEIQDRTLAPVLARHGVDLAAVRRGTSTLEAVTPIGDLHLTITVDRRAADEIGAPNVVGLLEGSDPELRDEYVIFSAHMDHVGVGSPNAAGDSIYNGADDDASGTAAVLELAEAYARLDPAPKRSLIFLTVSGEEKGLWGSGYYAEHPTVPLEQVVANLNIDMIGRNWDDTVVVIGKEHSDLGATLERVNADHPELNMTAIDDIWPEERFYFRSDHYNFARKGVPILFFFTGTHEDYHRPSDHVAKIDAEKESRIVRLLFYLGLEVANAPERPKWDPESYREIVEGGN